MARSSQLIVLLVLCVAGCGKQPSSPPTHAAESPEDAAAQARAVQDGVTPSLSDEQILRKIGYDPATLSSKRDDGPDGYSMSYSNDKTYIIITRSLVTGISILRLQPKEQQQLWILRKT